MRESSALMAHLEVNKSYSGLTSFMLPAPMLQDFHWLAEEKQDCAPASHLTTADLSKAVRMPWIERFFTLQHHDGVMVFETEARPRKILFDNNNKMNQEVGRNQNKIIWGENKLQTEGQIIFIKHISHLDSRVCDIVFDWLTMGFDYWRNKTPSGAEDAQAPFALKNRLKGQRETRTMLWYWRREDVNMLICWCWIFYFLSVSISAAFREFGWTFSRWTQSASTRKLKQIKRLSSKRRLSKASKTHHFILSYCRWLCDTLNRSPNTILTQYFYPIFFFSPLCQV